ncbi:hypothetical protein ACFFQW_49595 [Umezawaea endophytica]|uniref:hypothetical protein n=1 Tax=Umezawaea endophytica TaxID=1654476 RepID=UPI0035E64677
MALSNIPVNFGGHRLMVTEAPAVKMRQDDSGMTIPVVNREGEEQYVVMLFAKPRTLPGERPGKGEEIKVSLPAFPAEPVDEGEYVELVNPTLNYYEIEDRKTGRKITGISFKADGLKPAMRAAKAA